MGSQREERQSASSATPGAGPDKKPQPGSPPHGPGVILPPPYEMYDDAPAAAGAPAPPGSSPDDEPPPSLAPESTGTGWWFQRTGPDDDQPPPPSDGFFEPPQSRAPIRMEHVASHLERAVKYCLDTQDKNGSWHADPEPRIFETAVIGCVLSNVPAAKDTVERALRCLENRPFQSHDPVARLLEEIPLRLLRGDLAPVDLKAPTLYGNELRRKTLFLYTIGHERGASVLAPYDPDQIRGLLGRFFERTDKSVMKKRGKVDLIAIYATLLALSDSKDRAAKVCERLLSMQSEDGSFCRNPFSTAIAFMALRLIVPESAAYERCLKYLLASQKEDGTFRFCTSDTWDTSLMLRAQDDHPLFDPERAKRGYDFLLSGQNLDGGWGFRPGEDSDCNTTASVLIALHKRGLGATNDAVNKGLEYLLRMQHRDGLWTTWDSAEDHPVDDCVALVTTAISAFRGPRHPALRTAHRWLIQRYEASGLWQSGWYRSLPYGVFTIGNAILDASEGYRTTHPAPFSASLMLRSHQNMDHGFPPMPGEESTPSATGLAISAFLLYSDVPRSVVGRALSYLMTTQKEDGSWPGKPEVYGPRPLIYHLPTNAHAFASMGLMAAWRRLGGDKQAEA